MDSSCVTAGAPFIGNTVLPTPASRSNMLSMVAAIRTWSNSHSPLGFPALSQQLRNTSALMGPRRFSSSPSSYASIETFICSARATLTISSRVRFPGSLITCDTLPGDSLSSRAKRLLDQFKLSLFRSSCSTKSDAILYPKAAALSSVQCLYRILTVLSVRYETLLPLQLLPLAFVSR